MLLHRRVFRKNSPEKRKECAPAAGSPAAVFTHDRFIHPPQAEPGVWLHPGAPQPDRVLPVHPRDRRRLRPRPKRSLPLSGTAGSPGPGDSHSWPGAQHPSGAHYPQPPRCRHGPGSTGGTAGSATGLVRRQVLLPGAGSLGRASLSVRFRKRRAWCP